ncbi:FGGY family of carbohydrate kinase, N-terminal domain protein [Mycobacterium xenopi 3993]|nr:FGGY family of carbohydrate kinase, N-terminal domain protein [Mycobacterium xenopi 3993]
MSRNEVTIGIDIGTTAVKAVAADPHGRVVARTRVPHQLRVPAPDRLEHDADEAWRRGPLAALDRLNRPDARAVAVSAMVPSLTAVDSGGRPITPGLLYGDSRAEFPRHRTSRSRRWARRRSSCAGPPPKRRTPPGTGRHPRWPTMPWPVKRWSTTPPLTRPFRCSTGGLGADACAECGVPVERMPLVEMPGAAAGHVRGSGAVLAVGAIDALCEQIVAGADHDGDVLVLCGTTLIVWTTIAEPRQIPGLWTIPHTAAGKNQIGAPVMPAACSSAGWIALWDQGIRRRSIRVGCRCGRRMCAVNAPRFTIPTAVACSTAWISLTTRPRCGGLPTRRRRSSSARSSSSAGSHRTHRRRRWRHPGAAVDAGHRRRHRPAGAGVGGRRRAALGSAFLGRIALGLESSIADAARWAAIERVVEPDPAWTTEMESRYRRFLELAERPCRPISAPR